MAANTIEVPGTLTCKAKDATTRKAIPVVNSKEVFVESTNATLYDTINNIRTQINGINRNLETINNILMNLSDQIDEIWTIVTPDYYYDEPYYGE